LDDVSLNVFRESIQAFPVPIPASSSTGPELAGIKRFHTSADGYLTLHRKVGRELKHLGGFTPAQLDNLFPSMKQELAEDSYFSINAMWRSMPRGSASDNRYLNASYSDIDGYSLGLSVEVIAGKVIAAIAAGIIPSPSVIAFSGRGLWCYWFLRDASDANRRPRAYPDTELFYGRVQKALYRRLKDIGADANALDSARITRVPGSRNSKADGDGRVHQYVNLNPDGRERVYLLSELAEFVGVEEKPRRKFVRTSKRRVPARLAGWIARWSKSHGLLQTLRQMRGGFRQGVRHNAVYVFSLVGRSRGLNEPSLYAAALEVAQECKPPLPAADVLATIRNVMAADGKRHISTARIIQMLCISEQELAGPLKPFLPEPRSGRRRPSPRARRREERRARIREAVETVGRVPTSTELAAMLGEPQPTLFRDMVDMGLIAPKPRRQKTLAPLLPFIQK